MAIELADGAVSVSEIREMLNYSGVRGVNVKWFGAAGDGVTDDTDAIQAAVDWNDVILVATANAAAGTDVLTFASVPDSLNYAGVGNDAVYVSNLTDPATITTSFGARTKVESASSTQINLTQNIVSSGGNGVQIGDEIRFRFRDRGVIFFPKGTYLVTAPIEFDHPEVNITFQGVGYESYIYGNFAGAIISRTDGEITSGTRSVKDLKISNSNAAGVGVSLQYCINGSVEDCYISAYRGVVCLEGNSWLVKNCKLIWSSTADTSVGVLGGNGVSIINTDIQAYNQGIRHSNVGLQVIGGRIEVCEVGILLGQDEDGASAQSSAFLLTGISMESNQTGINLYNATIGAIIGVSQGTGVTCDYGLRVQGASYVVISGCSFGGNYASPGYAVDLSGSNGGLDIQCVSASNSGSGGVWNIPAETWKATFIGVANPSTFANLPGWAVEGTRGFVTNCGTSTFNADADGAGALNVPVFHNGSAWKVG